MSDRRDGWLGISFVVLAVVGSAVVSLPPSADPPNAITAFYEAHRAAIVVTQAAGLVGTLVFAAFVVVLRRRTTAASPGLRRGLTWASALVVAALALTAVPVLVLALSSHLSAGATHDLAVLGDTTDDLLFGTIALFAVTLAFAAQAAWLRAFSGVVAVLAAVRGAGAPLGVSALAVVAPLGFLALMVTVSVRILLGRRPLTLGRE